MKVADNLDRHKILDEFEFRQGRTILVEATCPCMPKNLDIFCAGGGEGLTWVSDEWSLPIGLLV